MWLSTAWDKGPNRWNMSINFASKTKIMWYDNSISMFRLLVCVKRKHVASEFQKIDHENNECRMRNLLSFFMKLDWFMILFSDLCTFHMENVWLQVNFNENIFLNFNLRCVCHWEWARNGRIVVEIFDTMTAHRYHTLARRQWRIVFSALFSHQNSYDFYCSFIECE